MDKIKTYQKIITTLLEEYAAIPPSYPTALRDELIIDTERNHFQLLTVGWEGNEFVHEAIFHLDIIDGKIWIQQNNSEAKLTDELLERGVPKSDIVLGFQHPSVREYSGFAVA
ncbi:MAG: XisI protein [Saprospiraceae bacterium]